MYPIPTHYVAEPAFDCKDHSLNNVSTLSSWETQVVVCDKQLEMLLVSWPLMWLRVRVGGGDPRELGRVKGSGTSFHSHDTGLSFYIPNCVMGYFFLCHAGN